MLKDLPAIAEKHLDSIEDLDDKILCGSAPLVLRGLVKHWPVVHEAKKGIEHINAYLRDFYNDKPVHLMRGAPEAGGRLFYTDDLSGFNYSRSQENLVQILDEINASSQDEGADTLYVGSTAIDQIMPGFRGQNDIPQLADKPLVSIWLGNRTRVAAHYDATDNIACVVAGRRRFTLFPPEQLGNLYVGPLDFTPAGQPASLVDFANPDFERFPKFKQALAHGMQAELNSGDALFIPSMWWHHVEGLDGFNILINYWWRQVPNHIGVPFDALTHALLSIRELPEAQRQAWKAMFDHYVFDPQAQTHIPQAHRGMLNPIDEAMSRRLRATLLNRLNR